MIRQIMIMTKTETECANREAAPGFSLLLEGKIFKIIMKLVSSGQVNENNRGRGGGVSVKPSLL